MDNRATKWSKLAKLFDNRNEHSLKNRFFTLLSCSSHKNINLIKKEKKYNNPNFIFESLSYHQRFVSNQVPSNHLTNREILNPFHQIRFEMENEATERNKNEIGIDDKNFVIEKEIEEEEKSNATFDSENYEQLLADAFDEDGDCNKGKSLFFIIHGL